MGTILLLQRPSILKSLPSGLNSPPVDGASFLVCFLKLRCVLFF